ELAARLDISASYVNQIESNQRPLTASVMLALADSFDLDLTSLATDASDRLVMDMREALADPVFGEAVPNLQELKSVASNAPDMARAVLALYEAYRKTNEKLASMDAALARDPQSGVTTAYEEVRDFFHYADNYIDPLDRAAEALAAELGEFGPDRLRRLIDYCTEIHAIRVVLGPMPGSDRLVEFDRANRTLRVNAHLEPSSQFFQIGTVLCGLEQATLLDTLLDQASFKAPEARAIARMGLANYFAGACRFDIEELGRVFGASLEQVAHRLSTMQRPRDRGVPFFFARVDAAGTITKRHSATALQFARFGGACPLWNVHRAFEAHGR